MNAFLFAAMLAFGAPDVQTTTQPTTQLYVKTVPPGAAVTVDGKSLGKSDGLFDVAAGAHKLTLRLDGFVVESRSIDVRQGEITRVEAKLKSRSDRQTVLSHVGDSKDGMVSFTDSGFAVAFQRPADMKSVVAVKLFAARYGTPEAPNEDFHVYLLDENKKVLEQVSIPYRKIARMERENELQWYTLEIPAIEVPEKFFVALWFNAEQTKGVYMGIKKKNDAEKHSYVGLPDKGYIQQDSQEWMIRAVVSSESGSKPTHPKVTTYEDEKAADTESAEALPTRTWNDATGAFSVEAQFAGVENGKVLLKKADGKIARVPLDRLSKEDRDFVAEQADAKPSAATPDANKVQELSHDNGKMAGKSSINGGGHAVRFKVDGDSSCVTSVSLHGSRYGEARPPKESFQIWICDVNFKPIATFRFPYSSYTRENPAWKTFRIRPTRVPPEFIVCFGFNPHQTKGVYVSFDDRPSETSSIGVPGENPPQPFAKGNWMIRCKVEKREASGQSGMEKTSKPLAAKALPEQILAQQQAKARERMRRDAETFSPQELREIETLYQVANKKWRSEEARESLKTLVEKYKKANRTGCAILYLGQMSRGDDRIAYFKQAIADHGDCFYGDGVQVGALARVFLGQAYLDNAKADQENADKAKVLFDEIRKDYADAVDHRGNLLIEQLPQ